MCGFVGGASNKHNLMFSKTINNLEILSHRGPDDSGLYQSEWMCAGLEGCLFRIHQLMGINP